MTTSPALPHAPTAAPPPTVPKISVRGLHAHFQDQPVVRGVDLDLPARAVTAIIGPSGCGKSTFIRCLNRMHELDEGASIRGRVLLDGEDIYGADVDPVLLRRKVGMVFQKPNPFPRLSVRENIALALRLSGSVQPGRTEELVEESLVAAALWEEVKDRLDAPGTSLSPGQQQRLCIARALATRPDVLLMDEPCAALDPIASAHIEDLIHALKAKHTLVVVTHALQQAARVSDQTALFWMGELIEVGDTGMLFTQPKDRRTEDYITGKLG